MKTRMKSWGLSIKKHKKSFLKYLIELLIVAFGVFLGIMVSENKANKKVEENISQSRLLIIDELEANHLALSNAVVYHEKIKKGFDSLRMHLPKEIYLTPYFSNQQFRQEQIPGWNGIRIIEVENVAFESAKIGGIFQNMDIDEVRQISAVYRQLQGFSELGNLITQKVFALNSDTKTLDVIGILEMLTNDFLNAEKTLALELEQTLQKLKNEND